MSYLGVGVSHGTVPVYRGINLKVFDRRVRIAELVLRFLVVANGLAACYSLIQSSLIQGLRCLVSMVRENVLFRKPLAWIIFSADQVMAYVTVAAVVEAGQSAVFAKVGQPERQWMKICDMYGKFFNRVGEGVASAFMVSHLALVWWGFLVFLPLVSSVCIMATETKNAGW